MAVNPLISLQQTAPDIGQTFSNALLNIGRVEQLKQARKEAPQRERLLAAQVAGAEAQVPTKEEAFRRSELSRISSLATGARQILPDLQAGNITAAMQKLQERNVRLQAAGLPVQDTAQAMDLAQNNPEELIRTLQEAIKLEQQIQPAKTAVQFGGQETFKDEAGNLFFGTTARNPATGKVDTVFSPIGGGVAQPVGKASMVSSTGETAEEKLETERKQSQIAIEKARGIEKVKLREKRASDIKAELSERNRSAARSERPLNQALTLAKQASQGLSGAAKVQLSRLIPGIDVADEAALDSSLKQLALEQLQQFKGPTTDFEFGVTQSIAGALGQSESSNIARINSLKRNAWFNKREFEQFQAHVNSGGDPDSFRFNFGESVRTKKGVFTLQDIQDTAVQNNLSIEETIKRLNQ